MQKAEVAHVRLCSCYLTRVCLGQYDRRRNLVHLNVHFREAKARVQLTRQTTLRDATAGAWS